MEQEIKLEEEQLFNYKIPRNAQAEQSVLGSILVDPDCVPEVLKSGSPDFFVEGINREIYETVAAMAESGKVIDAVTILDEMEVRGVKHPESRDYLIELMKVTPTAANVSLYLKILKEKYFLRRLAELSSDALEMANSGMVSSASILEKLEREVHGFKEDVVSTGLKPISDIIVSVIDGVNQRAENGGKMTGISTGLPDLDACILGLNPGELVLIASRPGMGKTSIAMNLAVNAVKDASKAVAIFSLEMSQEQLVTRMLSSESLVDSQKFQRGSIGENEWKRVISAATELSKMQIYINDNPMLTVSDMRTQCLRIKNLGLVVVDYLQLMQSTVSKQSSFNRQQQISDISRNLKILAKELKVPVLCMSQLSRACEARQDKRPMLSDLRESGAIEQDADVVIGLYRESYYNRNTENPDAAEALILKNRKGKTGKISLIWKPEYTMYISAPR